MKIAEPHSRTDLSPSNVTEDLVIRRLDLPLLHEDVYGRCRHEFFLTKVIKIGVWLGDLAALSREELKNPPAKLSDIEINYIAALLDTHGLHFDYDTREWRALREGLGEYIPIWDIPQPGSYEVSVGDR